MRDPDIIARTKHEIVAKLSGRYGMKRFLRDGHQTVIEDITRLHYEPWELKQFEHIECEWPLFFTFLMLDCIYRHDDEGACDYRARLEALTVDRDGIGLLPKTASLYLARGVLYVQLADYEKAEALMRTTVAKLEPMVAKGEADGPDYALMFDRVSLEFDHKPQRYGSQINCKDGHPQPMDLEDPARVDERRKAMGFKQTEAEYLALFSDMKCY